MSNFDPTLLEPILDMTLEQLDQRLANLGYGPEQLKIFRWSRKGVLKNVFLTLPVIKPSQA